MRNKRYVFNSNLQEAMAENIMAYFQVLPPAAILQEAFLNRLKLGISAGVSKS